MSVTASVAQIPGMMSMPSAQPLEGTSLGANETISYDGIALGNRVKLRGYVDFIYNYTDSGSNDDASFSTAGGVDFLVDFSPVTGEVHLAYANGASQPVTLEQVFGRYSFNQDFHFTFGRQATVLGFDADEAPGLYAVTTAYSMGAFSHPGKSYVDGIRLNYNNGMFGLILGLHDEYGLSSLTGSSDDLDDGIAIDLAASVMFMPGLEARLGFVNDNGSADDDVQQINGWLGWSPGDLTLAIEFDNFSLANDKDAWNMMLLANYQFSDFFGATLRYAHMDHEAKESDRITLALLFSITDNFGMNLEYSYTDMDSDDANEFYLEALLTY